MQKVSCTRKNLYHDMFVWGVHGSHMINVDGLFSYKIYFHYHRTMQSRVKRDIHFVQLTCIIVTNWGVCQGPISHNNEQTQTVEGII